MSCCGLFHSGSRELSISEKTPEPPVRGSSRARFIPGVSLARGMEIANVIHTSGRAIVYSGHQETAEHYWEQLKGAGLTMAPLEQG